MSPSALLTVSDGVATDGIAKPRHGEIDASRMVRTYVPAAEQQAVPGLQDPIRLTQRCTTAHMVQVPWSQETGWGTPVLSPYGKIALEPTASVLHYATETFEGMKAYRGYDNKLRLFRPQLNCARLIKSNARVCLPTFCPEQMLELIASYLAVECSNLYVRPAVIGSGSALGIQKPPEALFFLFAVAFPQSSGLPHPGIKLLASDPDQIRAWPGGFGSAKVGASYGPAMVAQAKAKEHNCSQTLWLFGKEESKQLFRCVAAQGTNILELVTTSLDTDIVLDGITRRSIIELARERLAPGSQKLPSRVQPLEVVERPFTMQEIVEAYEENRLVESFVSGTAMFITPVSAIKYRDVEVGLPMTSTDDGHKTPLATYSSTIKSWLEDIIYGRVTHDWGYVIDEHSY
ncbi:branched-chain amino acid cytosolic aminotransferase [Colletotrichum tofieldiae]|nr:branched-chain amino acid cytosolic aminotransferase [Colletotrichum tofieldiae]